MERPLQLNVRDLLRSSGGTATYEQVMAAALYDPEGGYYSRNIRDIGRKGDFSTTSNFHPVLGQALAAWMAASLQEGGLTSPWHVIEVGGGTGALAEQILKALPFSRRLLVRYHLVEKSPVLEGMQRHRLGFHKIRWHREMGDALRAAKGRALILSNELVDAFPAVVVQRLDGVWREQALQLQGEDIRRMLLPLDDSRMHESAFSVLRWKDAPEGQCCEVHASYREWLRSWAPLWQRGRLLTIDYGDTLPGLYDRRPQGSLRAYFAHQTLEGTEVLARPGLQDITADVNFGDLRDWGEELGWQNALYQTQGEFLEARVSPVCERFGSSPELAFLLSPEGAGGAFKVLEQRKESVP